MSVRIATRRVPGAIRKGSGCCVGFWFRISDAGFGGFHSMLDP